MSWHERPYSDDAFGRRPSFADNPLAWAPTLGHIAGIRVRVHVLFILFVLFELLSARFGVLYHAHAMFVLFGSVFLHELGHCFAARRVGGRADDILMWPLGGLATVDAPRRPWPQFVTVACGPLVNVAIAAVTWTLLKLLPARSVMSWYFAGEPSDMALSWGNPHAWLALLHEMNWWMFLFNLWPMYPMDGGRLLHCALWLRLGNQRSLFITTTVGMIAAVVMGLYGLSGGHMMLVAIAFMGYFECMRERMMLRAGMVAGDEWMQGGDFAGDRPRREGWLARWKRRRRDAARQAEVKSRANEQIEVDRILAKVHDHGLASLTRGERRTLETATARQRERETGIRH